MEAAEVFHNMTQSEYNKSMFSRNNRAINPLSYWMLISATSVGTVGTLVNVIVFTRPQMSSSPVNLILACLETSSLMLYFSTSVFGLTSTNYDYKFMSGYTVIFYVHFAISSALNNNCNWLMLTIAIWRLIGIKYPLKADQYCDRSKAKKAAFVILCLSVLLLIPQLAQLRISKHVFVLSDTPFKPPSLYLPNLFDLSVMQVQYLFIFYSVLPCLCLAVVNAALLVQLWIGRKHRNNLGAVNTNNEELRITVTLMVYMVLYLISIGFSFICGNSVRVIYDQPSKTRIMLLETYGSIYTLLYLNTISIFFYYYMSHKFRDTVKSLFNCSARKHNSSEL